MTERTLTRRQAAAIQAMLSTGRPVLGAYARGLIEQPADARRVMHALHARGLVGIFREDPTSGLRSWLVCQAGVTALARSPWARVDLLGDAPIGPWRGIPAQPMTLEHARARAAAR